MTDRFILDGSDFGVDRKRSQIVVDPTESALNVSVEIHADPERFETLVQQEPSKWGWCLYEPMFYAYGITLPRRPSDPIPRRIGVDERTDYDGPMAIYFNAHLPLFAWQLLIDDGRAALAEGYVSIKGTDWSKYAISIDAGEGGPSSDATGQP